MRFNPTTGAHDPGFTPAGAGVTATGIAVATDGTNIYLGAGGSDFLARYSPSGAQTWKRDTSGSAQAVRVSGGDLIVGGRGVPTGARHPPDLLRTAQLTRSTRSHPHRARVRT